MSFFSRGFRSGHSSPKQKKISKGGGALVWPFWNRMSSALRSRHLVSQRLELCPGGEAARRNMLWSLTIEELLQAEELGLDLPLDGVRV